MSTRTGIVLAGGSARRFGDRDKTLATLEGRPLVAHAIEPLQSIVDRVVVSCRREQIDAFEESLPEVDYRPDPTPDKGPLAGLAAALDVIDTDLVALTTADRPCIPSELYRFLFDSLSGEGVVILTDGIDQPAPGVFEATALQSAVCARRTDGERRLRSILEPLDLTRIPGTMIRERWGDRVLIDVNTEAELDALRIAGCK